MSRGRRRSMPVAALLFGGVVVSVGVLFAHTNCAVPRPAAPAEAKPVRHEATEEPAPPEPREAAPVDAQQAAPVAPVALASVDVADAVVGAKDTKIDEPDVSDAEAGKERSNVIFERVFADEGAVADLGGSGGSVVAGSDGRRGLLIETADPSASANRTARLDASRLDGRLVKVRAVLRAEGVSKPPNHWNGVKVMLVLEAGGGKTYPQLPIPLGTFDWRTVEKRMRLPRGVTAATLLLGLELVKGRVWFESVRITDVLRPVIRDANARPPFKGHDLDRLRGVMHGPRFDEKNFRDLASWGANHIRWQLNWVPMKEAEKWARDLGRYDQWLEEMLTHADKAADACERHGFVMLLDLHTPPGGRVEGGVCPMFSEKRYADHLVEVWRRLARRYRGRDVIYAYDLINEPVEPRDGGVESWRDLATRVARAIREIEPGKPILMEPGPWGGPDGFDNLEPLPLDRVIYGFHMYKPHHFTHQLKGEATLSYPGKVDGMYWDKERLRHAMVAAIEFQRMYGVHMHVGEFSAIRWAPNGSAYRYLRDVTDLFEEYKWDWAYHAYREWSGWSVEYTTDRANMQPATTPTDREKLLRGWFAKNTRPAASK